MTRGAGFSARAATLAGFALLGSAGCPARAQSAPSGVLRACERTDSIVVVGNVRIARETLVVVVGLDSPGVLDPIAIRRIIERLYATGDYDDVAISCLRERDGRELLEVRVRERPVLREISVSGVHSIGESDVRRQLGFELGRPADPLRVWWGVQRVDSLYRARRFATARVSLDSALADGALRLTLRVVEGPRVAVTRVVVRGAQLVPEHEVRRAMQTRPRSRWRFRRGALADSTLAADVALRVPALYRRRGFLDAEARLDTVAVDPRTGNATVRVSVREGPQYYVGSFAVVASREAEEAAHRAYPFARDGTGRSPSAKSFDAEAWEAATERLRSILANQGLLNAVVRPSLERTMRNSIPTVDLRWEVEEGTPVVVRRINIAGNDRTIESCVREQLTVLPGDVFSQDRLLRSYQNLGNLGLFKQPLAVPEVRQVDSTGDVDLTFRVAETRTATVNLGASVSAGSLGGTLSYREPNFLGRCKQVSAGWTFGSSTSELRLGLTDPAIGSSRISGSASVYDTRTTYTIGDLGQQRRVGGLLQLGLPVRGSRFTRLAPSYAIEGVRYTDASDAAGTAPLGFNVRSTLGVALTRDTRIELPFPTGGSLSSLKSEVTGGALGGSATYQRFLADLRRHHPLGRVGSAAMGAQPITFVASVGVRAGAIRGDLGPFYSSQGFALGGTQYGEQLRGYEEFQITPTGVVPDSGSVSAVRGSFGNAFLTGTVELGMRLNSMVYLNTFVDVGNVWSSARLVDPTKLYRGVGFGGTLVTPLGPIGLDLGYGLDRRDASGARRPRWQLHFRLGNIY